MSTIAVNQITDSSGLSAPVFPHGSAQLNPMAGREDEIINGDFSVWQRGALSTGLGYVAADRWRNDFSGGTVTQRRFAMPLGVKIGSIMQKFYLRETIIGQSLVSNYAKLQQRIESVLSYEGQTITVLGWARRISGAGNMVVEGEQSFGTGGAPSDPVTAISPTTVNLTGSWAPFAVVMNVTSIFGKTLGINGDDFFSLNFWTSAGANFDTRSNTLGIQTIEVDFAGIHIRYGAWTVAATNDYRPRDPGTELLLCQRYYETGDIGTDGGLGVKYGAAGAVTMLNSAGSYKVTKRINPAVSLVGTPQYLNCSNLTFAGGQTSITTRVNVTALGLYRAWDCQWASDAEL